jgi:hypothetical protein
MLVSAALAVAAIASSPLVAGIFALVGLALLALGLLEAGAATATVRHAVQALAEETSDTRAKIPAQSGV